MSIPDFESPASVKERIAHLIYREKTEGLSPDETAELEQFTQFEHLMRLLEAKLRERPTDD